MINDVKFATCYASSQSDLLKTLVLVFVGYLAWFSRNKFIYAHVHRLFLKTKKKQLLTCINLLDIELNFFMRPKVISKILDSIFNNSDFFTHDRILNKYLILILNSMLYSGRRDLLKRFKNTKSFKPLITEETQFIEELANFDRSNNLWFNKINAIEFPNNSSSIYDELLQNNILNLRLISEFDQECMEIQHIDSNFASNSEIPATIILSCTLDYFHIYANFYLSKLKRLNSNKVIFYITDYEITPFDLNFILLLKNKYQNIEINFIQCFDARALNSSFLRLKFAYDCMSKSRSNIVISDIDLNFDKFDIDSFFDNLNDDLGLIAFDDSMAFWSIYGAGFIFLRYTDSTLNFLYNLKLKIETLNLNTLKWGADQIVLFSILNYYYNSKLLIIKNLEFFDYSFILRNLPLKLTLKKIKVNRI